MASNDPDPPVTERLPGRARGRSGAVSGPNLALVASLVLVLSVTLAPVGGSNELHLMPFSDILGALTPPFVLSPLLGLVGNVALFAPLGAAFALKRVRLRTSLLLATTISAGIEATQLFLPGRTTSVDDVILNTLGTLLGYVLANRW